MHTITDKVVLSESIVKTVVEAPRIARKRRPGSSSSSAFDDHGERIPLTIADGDPGRGTITLIVQGVGKTTRRPRRPRARRRVLDLVGPLGQPSEIETSARRSCIGGGVGTAIAYPTAAALKEAGNHVVAILGARTKDLVILEDEIRAVADELHRRRPTTAATAGRGFVTDAARRPDRPRGAASTWCWPSGRCR